MTNYTELIENLRQFPSELRSLVATLSPEQLITPYNPGEWTIAQNVHHLADSHMNAFIRFKIILLEDYPTLKPYHQNDWAMTADANHADLEPSLSIVQGVHQRWTQLAASVTDWSRKGYHPENGDLSLERILTGYVSHGRGHLQQIREVLAAMPS